MGRWLIWGGGGIAVLVIAIMLVGYLLPRGHVAFAEARFERPPTDVFATIADVRRYAEWRPDVSRVEVLADRPRIRWKESGRNGDITLELEEAVAPTRLRSRIADPSLPFGGTWTYELTPDGGGTHVRITEHGEVYNPLFRFVSRFVFGHTATMKAYLDALGRRL
jgi:uncharacterized protein YndB with AHSA1/START domain